MKFDLSALDADSLFIALIGYLIVFISLVLLYFIFDNLPRVLNLLKRMAASNEKLKENPPVSSKRNVPGEVNAAIATSLHLYFSEMHDEEFTKLTINKVSRNYSPWSSKIYSVMRSQMMNK
ncbi:MAG: OadG family protein [Bacteroidota bacterium]